MAESRIPNYKQISTTTQKPTAEADVKFIAKINPTIRAILTNKGKTNDPNVVIVDARTPNTLLEQNFQNEYYIIGKTE